MTYVDYLKQLVYKLPIAVGGQNCHYKSSGAFTGRFSKNFKDTGCEYVIIGHSGKEHLTMKIIMK